MIWLIDELFTNTWLEGTKIRIFEKVGFLCVQWGICMTMVLEELFTNTWLEGTKIRIFEKVEFLCVQRGISMIWLVENWYWTWIVSDPV